MKHQMVEYQKRINQLRMLRTDLDEQIIVNEVQKMASERPTTILGVLIYLIRMAKEEKQMPWETDNKPVQRTLNNVPLT